MSPKCRRRSPRHSRRFRKNRRSRSSRSSRFSRPVDQEIPREEPPKKKQTAASQRKTFGLGTWTKIKNKIGNAIDDFYTNLTKEVEIKE